MSLRVDLHSRWQEFLDVQCWSGIITLHSLYITVVNGGLSHCCFNGPTSRNVAGIYWLSDVYCYSFHLGIVAVSPLSILGVPHHLAGAQHVMPGQVDSLSRVGRGKHYKKNLCRRRRRQEMRRIVRSLGVGIGAS